MPLQTALFCEILNSIVMYDGGENALFCTCEQTGVKLIGSGIDLFENQKLYVLLYRGH